MLLLTSESACKFKVVYKVSLSGVKSQKILEYVLSLLSASNPIGPIRMCITKH